ncbi:ras-associating and dilute domain-containing protein-like, partial [Sinocyclocheilus grahami]|uniref:ras-associating and dilute domain-containing protein-like n=1 Tax=Sinocyclocheilus grahami TaxID=75366 RepID=UPI0007AD4974
VLQESVVLASWSTLRAEFVHLNPAQLHHMLREYNTALTCPPCWMPSPEDSAAALNSSNILESFDNHPPLILPSSIFYLELGNPITEPGLFTPLQHLQEFIQSLPDSQTQSDQQPSQGSCSNLTEETAYEPITCQDSESKDQQHVSMTPPQFQGSHSYLSSCEAVLTQKLKCLELQNSLSGNTDLGYHKSLALDPSCLLTPPNTPQSLDQAELEASLLEGACTRLS